GCACRGGGRHSALERAFRPGRAVVADNSGGAARRCAMARCVLPRLRDELAIDLRTIDRHPLASVGTLVLGLRCSWCPGSAPMPKLIGLFALPPATRANATQTAAI